ncbi:type I-E CRISPR-associated protein Cse2/CasB [Azomonas macrocytogenes]|uniref:CRISPR system Cascade subunit CasB n=1 Tax=Azomonas macrocytogenes TaxID=69962 RepID=A0A839SZW1_AZOMA|nr:type I-E CRISPR-associated protein Cse2/CasB [Azomonas macrocytogenes]MBB3101734.1 CRISPR system Cascade subunit CasB [Azomonas macrocytogenes]
MKPGSKYLNEAQRKWVQQWWRALQPREPEEAPLPPELACLKRGDRAELRRCSNTDELLGKSATFLLADRLIALDGEKGWLKDTPRTYEYLALIAGVLAGIKEDRRDGLSLSHHLGSLPGRERPVMSELRFKRLQRSKDSADLYRQWQRAVQLAGGKADVAQLAADLFAWLHELGQSPLHASDSVKFRWAYDYYLSARERVAATDPMTDKEANA